MIQKGFDFQIAHYKEILTIKIKQLVSGFISLTNKIIIIATELQESVPFHFSILMSSRQRQQPKSYLNSTLLYDIYHEHRSSSGKQNQMTSYQEGFQAEQYLPTFLNSYKPPEKSSQVNPENADLIKRQNKQQISRPKQSIIFSAIQAKKGTDKKASSSNKQNHLNKILQSSQCVGPKLQTSSSKNSQPLNSHGGYLSNKQKFFQSKSQRIQQQKDLNFLSRTFYNAKKEQQNTEKQLLRKLSKKLEQEQSQRLKNSIKQKNMQLLNNQRIQNSTSKYMNHLMKYHAKKSLQQQNQKLAQTIREHSKSSTSLKTQRSVSTQQHLRQRAYLMKQSIRGSINQAKMVSQSRIHKKSNSVREGMAQTYKCERIFQTWMIDQINKKNRHIAETIRTTRKNNSMLKNVLENTKDADSNTLYGTLERAIKKNKGKTSGQL